MSSVGHPTGQAGVRLVIAAAAAFAVLSASGAAGAYGLKKTPGGLDVRWADPAVSYHLDPSVSGAALGAGDAIRGAAKSWSGLDGAPSLTVLNGGGGAKPGFDGLNTVFFARGGSTIAGGALAVTVFTFDDAGHALDADIIINGRYPFAVLPSNAVAGADASPLSNEGGATASYDAATPFDIGHVLAHELGHSLGLADETTDHSPLMYLYTSPGDASRRAPGSDDAAGMAALYDGTAASTAAGCGGSSVSPRGPSRTSSRVATALALALVVWAASRRRRSNAGRSLALLALAVAALFALPSEQTAQGSTPRVARSDARARVTRAVTSADDAGLFTTHAALTTMECRAMRCPHTAVADAFGGTLGGLHQEVGGVAAPGEGDDVEIALGDALAALTAPQILGSRAAEVVRIVSR
jgi:hypothetical protein